MIRSLLLSSLEDTIATMGGRMEGGGLVEAGTRGQRPFSDDID